MRRRSQFLTAGITAVAIAAIVALGIVSLKDRARIASLEARIAALESLPTRPLQFTTMLPAHNPGPSLESDGFGPARVIPITAR
jgi:hypothetical protein